jgi:hypothetical protein
MYHKAIVGAKFDAGLSLSFGIDSKFLHVFCFSIQQSILLLESLGVVKDPAHHPILLSVTLVALHCVSCHKCL